MDSRKWVTVFAALALTAAGGHARPGNEIPNAIKQSNEESNAISKENQVLPNIVDVQNSVPKLQEVNEVVTEKIDVKSIDTKTEEASKTEELKSEDQPVNERYPHAVLFGGTCGGTIISSKWILTAGHCTIFSRASYVLAGTNQSNDGSGVERRVKRLILHPKFSVGPYWVNADQFDIKQVAADWDFLLAELEDPLPLNNKTIVAAVLNDDAEVPAGLNVGYAGYGAANHGDYMRDTMHGMELEVKPDSVCQEALVQYEPKTMLCTQGRAPRYDSACNGDSGSGLVANGTLYGVASWVQDDAHRCFNGALVVFSRVSAVRDWIRQVTKI